MSKRKSIFQILMMLVLAVSLISPQTNLSAESSTPEPTDVVESAGEAEQPVVPSNDVPDGEAPEGQTPEGEGTEAETPEGQIPDGEGTEAETPEGETPEDQTPEGENPEGQTPEVKTPEGQTPEGEGTEVETPEVQIPQGEGTEVGTPEAEDANLRMEPLAIDPPAFPSPLPVEACQVSYAGHTRMTDGVGVDERVKIPNQEDGEINGDGWGTTMRLYAATRHDLTNVTLTYQMMGGGSFGTEINTLQSPGGGALQGNGYTVAASGYSVAVDGDYITVTIASMPANSSISFNIPVVFAEDEPHMYVHSWMTGTQTNCDTVIPPMPEIPGADVCQQVLAGRTITSGPNGNVAERPKFGEGGEVNADGWGSTFRLYGATDVPLTNVVATFQATQGFSFAGTYNTVSNPGAGNLANTGYTVAVNGITINVTASTVTVMIESMPANSSWSVNVPISVEVQTGKLYMDSTMIGTLTNCDPVIPPMPEIPGAEVCQQVLAGRTITSGPNANVEVRDKIGEGGEVNADGWASNFRLYGATDVPLTNVVATFQNTQGFSFAGTYNTVSNPGAGNLANTGYTVAVDGITIDVTPTTVTVTIDHMPANSSWSFNVPINIEVETGKLYMDSTMIGTETNCDPVIPPMPEIPGAEVCQQVLAGRTITSGPNANVEVRDKIGEGGEVNADGWASNFRLYGATDVPLTNVVATFQNTQGFSFAGTYNTVENPGVGNLANTGYTVPVEGLTIEVTPTTVTVMIESMPANSSWSFNVPINIEVETGKLYMDSTMIGDLVDCEPAVLALPEITESVCDDNYQATPVQVVAPEDSESVTYSDVTAVSSAEGITFTLTATVNHGFTLEGATVPEGWTVVNATEATYSVTLPLADCEVPLEVATPETPTLVAAVCDDDNQPVPPTLTVPETEGITYSEVTSTPANSVKLSLTATANEGYTFAGATMPEGWTLVSSSEAVYEIVADEAECPVDPEVPVDPEDPEVPVDSEDPKDEKPEEVTGLPETGVGSNPAPMIGLAATAAAAVAGAGIFFTNRKR